MMLEKELIIKRENDLLQPELDKRKLELAKKRELSQPIRLE